MPLDHRILDRNTDMNTLASLLLPLLSTTLTPGGDGEFSWPQWDGPELTGISEEEAWVSEGVEEDLWRFEAGLGYSTVSVSDGRVFTMGHDKQAHQDTVWCLGALSGDVIWSYSFLSDIWDLAHEGGTVNTPSVDGDRVYALNREGNFFCFEAETGALVWHTFLLGEGNKHELAYSKWGFSASPLVVGEELFLNCGKLLSIDKATGEVKWASNQYGDAYGTPIAFEHDGKPVLATLNGNGVGVVSRVDGSEIYAQEFGGTNRGINGATPVLIDDSLFVSSGTLPAGARFAFGDDGLIPVWQNREMVNSFSGCVRVGELLYGFDKSILKCLDFDGNSVWQERGIGNGAVMAAGDRLLVMGGTGELIVAHATPVGYEELSRTPLFEEGRYWTKPILVNGIVYCRSSKGSLVARDHRE